MGLALKGLTLTTEDNHDGTEYYFGLLYEIAARLRLRLTD